MSEEINSPEISSIHTSCKICCFAEYEGNRQVACSLDLIEKYKTKDTQIIEAYDDDKEFFIINNRKCVGFRKASSFKEENLSLSEKIDITKKSFKISYILFIDLKHLSLIDLTKIINDASTFDIKPSKIIIVRYSHIEDKIDFNDIQSILQNSGIGCEWRLQTIVDSDLEIRSVISTAIDNNPQYKFILYLNQYSSECNNIINKANSMVFDDLESFEVLTDREYSCKIFLGLLYRYIWHISRTDILEDTKNFTVLQ